ncbi:hypothetical protein [Williamsia herbipolensis]|uniref:hypothetical protein n=1 Tax=Williamsia herbipolensis TaxID=1603258 RepID=UPI0005F786AC|nr:hypothetical protein [Williamsia herbipolensis]
MSKPAPAAKPAEIDRREAMDRWMITDFRRPTTTSVFHPLYRWPSDTDDDYAARCAAFEARQRTTQTTDRTRGRHRGDTHRRTTP